MKCPPAGLLATLPLAASGLSAKTPPLRAFSTNGHTVYHLRCGKISPSGEGVLMAAAYDGAVLCLTHDGKQLWKSQVSDAFPFDLAVADLDGDGRDDTFVAAADGSLYVLDHEGKLRWKFTREPPLLQVCPASAPSGEVVVLTGGVEKKLYALSASGEVLSTFESPYVVRHIRAGNIMGDGKQYAAVVTAKNDKSRFFLQVFDPVGLKPMWEKPLGLSTHNPTEGTKFEVPWLAYRVGAMDMLVLDLNKDGRDEMILTDHFERRGEFSVYDYQKKKLLTSSRKGLRGRPYRMNLLTHARVSTSGDEFLLGLFGDEIIVYELDGSIRSIVNGPYAFAEGAFDPETNTYFVGSSISGGDGLYALRLADRGWPQAFTDLKPVGKLARLEQNLARLAQQVEAFEPPAYQPAPRETRIVTGRSHEELQEQFLSRHQYANVKFAEYRLFTEDYDRSFLEGVWKTKRETRHKYDYRAEQIIAYAREREERGEPFVLWAGHGNDPFYMRLSTLKGILDAAPTMAKGFVFPEMERTDEDMAYAVRTHLLPLAELCRKHGVAKIILRNKNIFWNASCYLDLWRDTLLGGKCRDLFVPSMEETNGRTQAISLSGRVGLWLTGHFEHLSARAVTDNANFSRFWEWGAQQKQSHLLRAMTLGGSLGADLFLVNVYQGDPRDMTPFYQMLEKGLVAIPRPEDLLSVSEVCLGMRDPSPRFLEHGKNGHNINRYEPDRKPMVFDRLDCYWGGAPTAEHDFSRYAMGSQRRMLNFLPTNPYGFIASIPVTTDLSTAPHFTTMLQTDGEYFYDNAGAPISAPDFKPRAEQALRDAATRLPILVRGEVAWAVVRLDPTHVRVTLLDPGYLVPQDREAEIVLQHLQGTECRDILSGERLPLRDGKARLTVPAGTLRIVDVAHESLP